MRLIGLTGLAGHGKDSVRAVLERECGAIGMALADPLRDMLTALLLPLGAAAYITARELKETPVPGLGVSYRRLAQTLGTEWGREQLGDDFWLKVASARLERLRDCGAPAVVVSDVRFWNEVDWLRQNGGELWRVERPGVPPVVAHESEAHVASLPVDGLLLNSGTLGELEVLVLQLYRQASGSA